MKQIIALLLLSALLALFTSACETVEPETPGALVPLTVDDDPSLPSIAVNGTLLHAEAFGVSTDPMLVVLHGGPGGDYRSLLNCRRFTEDGFYVVFYDQRGSGLSRRHNAEPYRNVGTFIDDLDAVIAHYRQSPAQKVVLLGQSWGAMLATAYINDHPDAIAGAILSEPGGFTWHDAKEFVKRTRALGIFGEATNDYLTLDEMITGNEHNVLDYKAALQSIATSAPGNKYGDPGPEPFWRFGAVCNLASARFADERPFDFTTHLSRFTTKILFLYSEFDEAYGRAHAEMVSSAYPRVELVEITGTGHGIPYFGWDRFAPVVRTYLTSVK